MWFSSGSCGLIVVLYQVAGVLPAQTYDRSWAEAGPSEFPVIHLKGRHFAAGASVLSRTMIRILLTTLYLV
jgi:hypothetical protein